MQYEKVAWLIFLSIIAVLVWYMKVTGLTCTHFIIVLIIVILAYNIGLIDGEQK